MDDKALEEAEERLRRMREAGHEMASEEEKQANLDMTVTMMEWDRELERDDERKG